MPLLFPKGKKRTAKRFPSRHRPVDVPEECIPASDLAVEGGSRLRDVILE